MPLRLLLASTLLLAAIGTAATGPVPRRTARPVTWSHDIAPLVYRSCVSCHHAGGPGPFPLLTYPKVRAHAQQIAQVTASRFMPPWLPEPVGVPLAHARRLTEAQVALFRRWAAEGAPEGDLRAAPLPPTFQPGWTLGAPDQVVTMPRPYLLPAETTSPWRCFVLPLALPTDRRLRTVELRPGNPAVVRHMVLYEDPTGAARRLEAQSGAVGYVAPHAGLGPNAVRLAEWSVGDAPWVLPVGSAETLPAHSDLVLLLRFETDGQPEAVRSQVGLYFALPAPTIKPVTLTLGSPDLILQPPQRATVTDGLTLPVAVRVLRVTPHGHPVCRTLSVSAQPTSGPVQALLQINDWNADWQDSYEPQVPLVLPAGTRLTIRWTLDDSADNPRNPASPPMTAEMGLSYLDDMATVGFLLLPVNPADAPRLTAALSVPRLAPTVQATAPDRHG